MGKINVVLSMMYGVRSLVCTLLISFGALSASAQNIAVNTDALMDMAGVPSLGVEMAISKRTTLGVNAAYSPAVLYKCGSGLIVQPEYRFYFSGRPMYRHFIGLVGMYADYDLHFHQTTYKGNASGVGLSFGYVWNVSNRWFIDFHSSLGAVFYKHKEYDDDENYVEKYQEADGSIPANAHGTICMPLRIGISVSYVIK